MRVAVLLFICVGSVFAQDAGMVLSTSVGYNTQRASLKLTPEQAAEAARLGAEAQRAAQAGKYADALRYLAQGTAVMHGVEWTADVELASSLKAKVDHAMTGPGKVTLSLTPIFPADRAPDAHLKAAVYAGGVSLAPPVPVDMATGSLTEQVAIPPSLSGDADLQVRLTRADGAAPGGLQSAFVKTVPIHVEDLSADAQRLRQSLAAIAKTDNAATANADYTLALYERADSGAANPHAYNFKKEFATAQSIADAVRAGKDPFAGKHGDFRKAYRSKVDGTLQPYRLFIPDTYDGTKPLPLMVALHGMGGDENTMFDAYGKELVPDAQKAGFIVVAPKGRDPASMYTGAAEQDVLDAMDEVERDYKVDRSRVYLMGHSMGGYGTWSIAMDHPDLFAALGPISGGGDVSGMVKIRNIPQYVTHGDDDKTVNVSASRTMVEAGKKAGAPITYVEVPGGSHTGVAQPAFAPMIEFFAKQVKAARP